MKKLLILLLASLAGSSGVAAAPQQDSDPQVEKVLVIFKTHLDIGFTDLSSKVEQRYIDHYIPKAIEVARRLREEGGDERYVWTTGAWLVDAYLRQATPEAAAELEEAIRHGDIAWNGVPYTVESESMNRALFEGILRLSQRLDARFGKHTSAAKMTDVPGHTRSIVPLLSEAGIGFLHVGTNPAVSVPDVPPVCRWRDPATGREIILMYQGSYGDTMLLPDGRTAVSINLTGDNHGPHSIEEVHRIFASLRERYPSARIVAASLNDVAAALEPMRAGLPVVTSEIGDTWIYGYGSAPLRMARFRELGRLYDGWIRQGRLAPDSDAAIDFAVRLGMIAEHTWGADVKTHLRNWDKYDFDSFTAARTQPEFRFMEESWRELDDNIDRAVELLPAPLREEAREALKHIGKVDRHPVTGNDSDRKLDAAGRYAFETKGVKCLLGGITYQSFSNDDYTRFQDAYLTSHVQWAIEDNGKPGLDRSPARSATIEARVAKSSVERSREGRRIHTEMAFPEDARIDPRVLPEAVRCQWEIARDGRSVAWTVDLIGKPANRMPEAYWVSIRPEELLSVVAEKTGGRVDLLDVVPGGNRQMHGIDRYVDLVTRRGTLRITSPDALLAVVGECNALNYSTRQPDLRQGVHFCLYDNLWGTNFSMWWGGDMRYRFRAEWIEEKECSEKP
ncbi:DUF5054 domain-containing protein [uncultured Alistipes sp.]|uniref:DUF5054 domain-containing protein n=1 Tax=uncultured Alistipes sp. TaxID=538949 RepID=UPI00262F9650|nr:DUF5054 domain-containing protein [uncultured Alistipes sp.]